METKVPFSGTTSYKDQYQPYKIKNIDDTRKKDSMNPEMDSLSPVKGLYQRPPVKF